MIEDEVEFALVIARTRTLATTQAALELKQVLLNILDLIDFLGRMTQRDEEDEPEC